MKSAKNTKAAVEQPEHQHRHVLADFPYRAVVFTRMNQDTPLFFVAGVEGGPFNARRALLKAAEKHGASCYYCSEKLDQEAITVDHVEPLANGGSHALGNLVLACKPCNQRKGSVLIELFNEEAGRNWLEAARELIEDRLSRLPR